MTTQPDSLGLYPNPYGPTPAEWMDAAVKATLAFVAGPSGEDLLGIQWKDATPASKAEVEAATPALVQIAGGSMAPNFPPNRLAGPVRLHEVAAGVDQMGATPTPCPDCGGDGFHHWQHHAFKDGAVTIGPLLSDDPCPTCDGSGMQP